MRLSDLMPRLGMAWRVLRGDPTAVPVGPLAYVSRHVVPGALFVAVPLVKPHPDHSVADALARGAAALIRGDRVLVLPAVAALAPVELWVADERLALARLAAILHPGQPPLVAAVTGTNGKTSTAEFTRQLWTLAGRRAASFGTLGLIAPERRAQYSFTTPGPLTLHQDCALLAADGVEALVIEASSHALDQKRAHALQLGAAAFTNLTRDHLDYHGDMTAYWRAKRLLFDTLLPPGAPVVVNLDGAGAAAVATVALQRRQRLIGVSGEGREEATVSARPLETLPAGQRLRLRAAEWTGDGREGEVVLPLVGGFHRANALVALGLALATGVGWEDALAGLARLSAPPGRLQRVLTRADGAAAYVDYAHTPDALETVLATLAAHARRLVLVFGCGGNRDAGKRAPMGAIAARRADRVIVTDDNPRREDPAAIRAQILAACPGAVEIGDRRAAIAAGLDALGPGDVLLVAGKGHEEGQDYAGTVLPFDDAEVLRALAGERGGEP